MKARSKAQRERLHQLLLESAAKAAAKRAQAKAALESGLSPEEVRALLSEGGSGGESLSVPEPPEGGGGGGGTNGFASTAKFYRVARTALVGTVDGWGSDFASIPPGLTNVVAVSASPSEGGAYSLALTYDGRVVAWGTSRWGQTNVPANLSDAVAIAAGGRHAAAVRRDGTVALWGDNTLGQITNAPAGLTNVVDLKAGLWHTLALKADGTVAAWGDLFNRSNAVPPGLSNVIAIAAGPRHCLALKSDGTVAAWGFDLFFRGYYRLADEPPYLRWLGANPPTNMMNIVWLEEGMPMPTNVPPGFTAFYNFLPTNGPPALTNAVAIAAGMRHNLALLSDGRVLAWSRTNIAALEVPVELTNAVAVSSGWHYGAAVDAAGTVKSWGEDYAVLSFDSVVGLSVGAQHGLVIRTNMEGPVIRRQPRQAAAPRGSNVTINVQATSSAELTYQWQRGETNSGLWTNLAGRTESALVFTNLQDADDGHYRWT